MSSLDVKLLKRMAGKYVWWKTPDEAIRFPRLVVAQVMNIGDYDDVQVLAKSVGEDYLREVIVNAEIGQFNDRSWHYWHYRLGLAEYGKVPPIPKRRVA